MFVFIIHLKYVHQFEYSSGQIFFVHVIKSDIISSLNRHTYLALDHFPEMCFVEITFPWKYCFVEKHQHILIVCKTDTKLLLLLNRHLFY